MKLKVTVKLKLKFKVKVKVKESKSESESKRESIRDNTSAFHNIRGLAEYTAKEKRCVSVYSRASEIIQA